MSAPHESVAGAKHWVCQKAMDEYDAPMCCECFGHKCRYDDGEKIMATYIQ